MKFLQSRPLEIFEFDEYSKVLSILTSIFEGYWKRKTMRFLCVNGCRWQICLPLLSLWNRWATQCKPFSYWTASFQSSDFQLKINICALHTVLSPSAHCIPAIMQCSVRASVLRSLDKTQISFDRFNKKTF